jgi:transcriptional regulator with XRE-family HTH domain
MAEKFGKIVADACKRQGVSHSELARRLGVSQSRVPEILRSGNMTERLLKRCAYALGMRLQVQLIEEREEQGV